VQKHTVASSSGILTKASDSQRRSPLPGMHMTHGAVSVGHLVCVPPKVTLKI
jgi:hypothetical protein